MKPLTDQIPLMAVIFAVTGISFAGYSIGLWTGSDLRGREAFRITGDSMAPTIAAGSICTITPVRRPLQIGDVVAVRWGGKRRVKRVAAVTGNTVDLDEGRLLVDGRRLEDRIADRRDQRLIRPASVPVVGNSDNWSPIVGRSGQGGRWFCFTYRNPHQGDQATAIMDDYPDNQSVRRKLHPVDRLIVRVPTGTQVAFYRGDSPILVAIAQEGRARSRDAVVIESERSDLAMALNRSLDASHPIAVRVDGDGPELATIMATIQVRREIEYRDDRPSGEMSYPLTLKTDEVFLVGDNVPVSIDSRRIGPIKGSSILGHVEQLLAEGRTE